MVEQQGVHFRGRFFPAAPPMVQPCSPCLADGRGLVPSKLTVGGVGFCGPCGFEYEQEQAEKQRRLGAIR